MKTSSHSVGVELVLKLQALPDRVESLGLRPMALSSVACASAAARGKRAAAISAL